MEKKYEITGCIIFYSYLCKNHCHLPVYLFSVKIKMTLYWTLAIAIASIESCANLFGQMLQKWGAKKTAKKKAPMLTMRIRNWQRKKRALEKRWGKAVKRNCLKLDKTSSYTVCIKNNALVYMVM